MPEFQNRRLARRYRDGIHLDFSTGIHYVKGLGAAPRRDLLTNLFTFTSGNESMYVGASGLLVAAETNTPRIEYDPDTRAIRGLLMESSRTNLGLWSNDHTNAAWVKTTMTTAKTSTGPDGVANSATRLTATGANSTSLQTVTSASATRAYSVWMRRITGTGNVDMTLDNGTGWTTKTLTTSWAKYEITQAAVTNPVFGIRLVTNGDAIDVYGNQLESTAFSSSLIPTTTVAISRTADICSRTLGSEFSATAGTVFCQGRSSGGQDAANGNHFWDFANTSSNRIRLFRPLSSNAARTQVTSGGVTQALLDGTFSNLTAFKAACAFSANDFSASFNGGAVVTDAAGTVPSITALGIGGSTVASDPANGHILKFDYDPIRRPDTYLIAAST